MWQFIPSHGTRLAVTRLGIVQLTCPDPNTYHIWSGGGDFGNKKKGRGNLNFPNRGEWVATVGKRKIGKQKKLK